MAEHRHSEKISADKTFPLCGVESGGMMISALLGGPEL
jgi:hypothetical protein